MLSGTLDDRSRVFSCLAWLLGVFSDLHPQCGRSCLAEYSPNPFRPLVELLYSEKKPGELTTRQCIVELVTGLFEVFPNVSTAIPKPEWRAQWGARNGFGSTSRSSDDGSNSNGSSLGKMNKESPQLPLPDLSVFVSPKKSSVASSDWESADYPSDMTFLSRSARGTRSEPSDGSNILGNDDGKSAHALVKSLMIGPPNQKEEARVDFMQQTHRKRIFKLWIEEIIGVLSDYFW